MEKIGDIPMPPGFRYRKVFARGKPVHAGTDPFRRRHPGMDLGRRAKIFNPFDALRGFDEAVSAKREFYEDRRELNEEDRAELDRRTQILVQLAGSSRRAREHEIRIRVTYFALCRDPQSTAFEKQGQYRTAAGICRGVDPYVRRSLRVDGQDILFENIYHIESPDGIFDSGSMQDSEL